MATQHGVNATKRLVNKPSEKIEAGEDGGRVRVSYDSITNANIIPSGDKILLGRLPKDARLLWVKLGGTGSTGAVDLGWEASADGDEAGDANGVATARAVNNDVLIASPDKKFSSEVNISATVTTDIAVSGTLSVSYMYAID